MKPKLIIYVLFAVVALAAFGGGAWLARSKLKAPPAPSAAEAITSLNLRDIDGKSQDFRQWRGKVLVVNFWATWCAPCREEIPMFVKAQAAQGAKGLQFVGIAIDGIDKTREFAATYKINYPAVIGAMDTLAVSEQAGNSKRVLPYTVVLDRKGAIVATEAGGLSDEKLQAIITPLL